MPAKGDSNKGMEGNRRGKQVTEKEEVQQVKSITEHEGSKYLRTIIDARSEDGKGEAVSIKVDVYSILEAFSVTCPARAHAIKKLLCAGQRGKGSELEDLEGAMAALSRAIELQKCRG